ncbi:MAG: NDP-sugar synthase [Candidatus Heimdallarchaeota archaeon]|nr:MAG: NDP-sugar synthase [Candidatus Heimdallarchaeota archaeon]
MESWSAVVLAGGIGSRLHPLTINRPKPMVPVANKPMIDYNLELLRNAGINGKIIIITKYLHQSIRDYFDKISHFDDLEIVLPKVDPLGTADAVRKASNFVDTDNFIVSMADIITNLPLNDFMAFHTEKKGIASITLKDVPHPRAFGVIMLNQDSKILLFLEKPIPQELGLATLTFSKKETIHLQSNLVNTGIYAFKHGVLDILESLNDFMDFGKDFFPYLAREYGIFGYAQQDYYWMDAGNPETYLYTNWDVLRRWAFPYFPRATSEENNIWINDAKPSLPSGSYVEPPAALGADIDIGHDTVVKSHSVVGDRVAIGNNCIIDASIIWDDVFIGDNVIMKNSIVCNDVQIETNSQLKEGTVVGPYFSSEEAIVTQKGEKLFKK